MFGATTGMSGGHTMPLLRQPRIVRLWQTISPSTRISNSIGIRYPVYPNVLIRSLIHSGPPIRPTAKFQSGRQNNLHTSPLNRLSNSTKDPLTSPPSHNSSTAPKPTHNNGGSVTGNSGGTNLATPKKPLMLRIKEEARHYWLGTKLLAKEIKISTRLLWRLLRGLKLTRREHLQLVRTAGDLFRLIPFAIFIIVPFMELLLPVALKLFPNMLPSTYSDKEKEEAKRKQAMAGKLNMAKFLRDSIAESSLVGSQKGEKTAELTSFFKRYRTSGEKASTEEVLGVCKKFSDEFTLENLSRPQLVTLCRFMGVNTFGTDNFLRFALYNKMRDIKDDDKMIVAEGVDSLTQSELIAACQARGIRSLDVSMDRLRYELQQFLDLHVKHEIPSSILILSRAMMLTDRSGAAVETLTDSTEALQDTLTSLPNELVEEAELRLSEAEGKVSIEKKLDIIEKEEKKIAAESVQADKERKAAAEAEAAASKASAASLAKPPIGLSTTVDDLSTAGKTASEEPLTKEQVRQLGETLTELAEKSKTDERKQLEELKEDRVKLAQEEITEEKPISKTKRKQLQELDELIVEIEEYLNIMETERQRTAAEAFPSELRDNVTTEQVETALKMIRHAPNEKRIKQIVKQLDADGDGKVFLKEIMDLNKELDAMAEETHLKK